MRCERWKTNAFSYIEGALPDDERAEYARHLQTCPDCEAEVATSRALVARLGNLSDPEFSRDAALRFDSVVMSRLRAEQDSAPATAEPRVPVATGIEAGTSFPRGPWVSRPAGPRELPAAAAAAAAAARAGRGRGRQWAARSISVAARRQLDRRQFEPLFAPLPSLILVCLALASGSVALAIVFGDVLVRGLGGGFAMAVGSIWNRAAWFAGGAVDSAIDLMTIFTVLRGVVQHVRPWLEACRVLWTTHTQEIVIVAAVAAVLVAGATWKVSQRSRATRAPARPGGVG